MTKLLKFILFVLSFWIFKGNLNAQIQNLEELVGKSDKAILKIFTVDEYGELTGQGSGVIIDAKGIAVTNYHVLEGAADAIAITITGEKFNIEKIIDYSSQNDLVKFKLENKANKIFSKVNLSSNKILKGASVFAIGYPNGFDLLGESTVSEGIVSGIRKDEVLPGKGIVDSLIQTTAQITHGSSGGGLFDAKGNLIGITQGTFALSMEDLHANLNRVISVKHVRALKRDLNYSFESFLIECSNSSLYAQGVMAYNEGEYGNAYDLFDQYQKLNEVNLLDAEAWYMKGNCAFHIGRRSKETELLKLAMNHYFQALDLDSMNVNVRCFMAMTFELLGEIDYGFEVISEAYQLNPNNAFVNYVLGKLYNVSEKRDLAIRYLSAGINLFEEKDINKESLAKWYLERAVAYEMNEDLYHAEADFLKCLDLNRYDIGGWYHYGSFLLYHKKYKEACFAFQTVYNMDESYNDYNGTVSYLIKVSCK